MSSFLSVDAWSQLVHVHGLVETFFIVNADELEIVAISSNPYWGTYRHRKDGTYFWLIRLL